MEQGRHGLPLGFVKSTITTRDPAMARPIEHPAVERVFLDDPIGEAANSILAGRAVF
jgi:hypothetical protein